MINISDCYECVLFGQITEEWREIKFCDADCVLMGVTKLTDVSWSFFYSLSRGCFFFKL